MKFLKSFYGLFPILFFASILLADAHFDQRGIPAGTLETLGEAALWVAITFWLSRCKEVPKYLYLIPTGMGLGDFLYSFSHYIFKSAYLGAFAPLTYAVPYVVAMALICSVLLKATKSLQDRKIAIPLSVVIAGGLLALNWFLVIEPSLFQRAHHLPFTVAILTCVFSILESVIIGFSSLLLILCGSVQIQLVLFGILTLAASDIAIRYDSVYLDLVGKPIFENGWFLGIALMASGVWALSRQSELIRQSKTKFFLKFHSIRAITIGLIFVGLSAFWVGISFYFKTIHSADQVSASLLVLLLAFGFSLVSSHLIGKNLSLLTMRISERQSVLLAGLSHKLPQEIKILSDYLLDLNAKLALERDKALQMVSVTAHDLRGPLKALKSSSDLMHSHISKSEICQTELGSSSELLKLYLESVENVVSRLKKETARLKSFETIGQSLNRAITLAKTIHPEHRFTFVSEKDAETLPVEGLGEVVSNLLNNSVEASKTSSSIAVKTGTSNDGSKIIIQVKDSGVGIAENVLRKIRKGAPYTTKAHGSGIGLSSLKSWAVDRGYEVEINSRTGDDASGTTVQILIPTLQNQNLGPSLQA